MAVDLWGGRSSYPRERHREAAYGQVRISLHRRRRGLPGITNARAAKLQPTRTATTIRSRGDKRVVVDGPFIEAKESVGGFSVLELSSKDEAVALAKTWPGYGIEIRPIREG